MKNIEDLVEEITDLQKRLTIEIQKKEKEYFYKIQGKKVRFEEATRQYHKTLATRMYSHLTNARLLNVITGPIIWFCLVPAVFLDLVTAIYQFICFPVYKIPKVRRSDYIVIDRHELSYLNPMEKLCCVYCGYFTGLIAYIQEIAARTEQYWCPIKHARKVGTIHSRYKNFLEYGDGEDHREKIEKIRKSFKDLE